MSTTNLFLTFAQRRERCRYDCIDIVQKERDPPRSTALAFRAAADQDDALHDAAVGDRAEPCTTAAEGGQAVQAAVLGAGDDVVGADRRLT